MKFVIHTPVLNADDTVLGLIDRLIDRFADEVHWVDVQDADLLQESNWYQQARPMRRRLLMSAVARPVRAANDNRGPHARSVEVVDPESARLADRLAHASLMILVEDRESDGVLLDIVVEELAWQELKTIWTKSKTVTPRAIEVVTAGGQGAIPQRVERAVSDAAEEGRPHRVFVLCDSDAKWPGDVSAVTAVSEACARHSVPYHVWTKRCAENYIPDQVFEAAREDPGNLSHVDRFNAFLRLPRPERDHFPVKAGLAPMERSEAQQAGLYKASNEEDLKLLKRRLFQSRPRPMLRLSRERRASFTAEGLRARDGNGELEALLHAIAREL